MNQAPLYHESGIFIDKDEALDNFLKYVANKKLELYPAQEDSIIEIFNGNNVILNTPTGSGKSLVATASHYYALTQGKRSFYTSPVKALVNEKFFSLCHDFGADKIGLITGDAKVNEQAPIICCTAEIIANMCLKQGEQTPCDDLVIDEFHYYSDRDRGTAWQLPLLTLKNTRFLLMSATFGDTEKFQSYLEKLTDKNTVTIKSEQRPVPLSYTYEQQPLEHTIQDLIQQNKTPVYIVNFTQKECAQMAQNLLSYNFTTKEEKKILQKN